MTALRLRFPEDLAGILSAENAVEEVPFGLPGDDVVDPVRDRREARENLDRSLADLAGRIREMLDEVAKRVDARLEEWSRYAVELGLALASEVLRKEVDAGTYDLAPAVRECLEAGFERRLTTAIVIHLHPEDLSPVIAAMDRTVSDPRFENRVRYEVDPTLDRGTCRIETGSGRIIHDPREVLERMIRGIRERLG